MADYRAKGLLIDVLHDQKRQSLLSLARVKKGHNAGVIDARQRFHFGLKLSSGPFRGPRERLDHHPFREQLAVLGEINGSEAAAAQLLNDAIAVFQDSAGG